jgi:Fungal specific transcription factor domain
MMRCELSPSNQEEINSERQFDQIRALKNHDKFDNGSELQTLLKKCKDIARVVKADRPISSYTVPDFKAHVPSRGIADQLVQLYFATFESTYRILHRALFFKEYEEYWKDPTAASTSFVVKLLLVLAIGIVFYEEDTNERTLRSLAPKWIYAAQTWLSGPFEKTRLNLSGVEVQCLVILARQTHNLEGDLLWITVGTLLRTAMSMGLHRDPSHFPKIPVFHAELRRRLWATIIELATQSSLDCGMPPMFSFHDFDCEPPANYNDADIDEQAKTYPPRNPDTIFTDSSIQIALLRSLRTRLEISSLVNDFRSIPPYEKVLALSSDLTSHIRSLSTLYASSPASKSPFTTPHSNLLDLFTRRFLLALHHPFAIQAKTDHRFYFSRKVSLDATLAILSQFYPNNDPSSSPSNAEDQHLPLTLLLTGGFFQETLSRASTAVALELLNQIKEDSSPLSGAGRAARKPLHDMLEQLVKVGRKRVQLGSETNVKGYLFLCMVQSQAAAMERGEDFKEAIAERAKVAAEEALGFLTSLAMRTPLEGQTPGERVGQGMEENGAEWDLLVSCVRAWKVLEANECRCRTR